MHVPLDTTIVYLIAVNPRSSIAGLGARSILRIDFGESMGVGRSDP